MMINVKALETGSFYYITQASLTTCGPWDGHPRVRMSCSQLDLNAFSIAVSGQDALSCMGRSFSSWSVPLVETHKRPWYCDSERFVDSKAFTSVNGSNQQLNTPTCVHANARNICTESLNRFQNFKVTAAFCYAEYHRDHIRFPFLRIPSHQGQYQLVGKAGNVPKKIKRWCI